MVAITTYPTPSPSPSPSPGPRPVPGGVAGLQLVPPRGHAAGHGAVGRLLGVAALVLVLAVAVGYLVSSPPLETSGATAVQDAVHVVAHGETMWSIAAEVAPAGEAATYVERLVEVNGSATVVPGQELELPVP